MVIYDWQVGSGNNYTTLNHMSGVSGGYLGLAGCFGELHMTTFNPMSGVARWLSMIGRLVRGTMTTLNPMHRVFVWLSMI